VTVASGNNGGIIGQPTWDGNGTVKDSTLANVLGIGHVSYLRNRS
jgi:hypothetical protein